MKNQFTPYIDGFSTLLDNYVIPVDNTHYANTYMQHLLLHKNYYLKIYSFVLDKLCQQLTKPLSESTLVDFGCGNGLLALFAKFCGFKTVIALDTNELFIATGKALEKSIKIEINHWICGDELQLLAQKDKWTIDAIVATDVVEHIYSIEKVLSIFIQINPDIVIGFTTASVYENYFKRKQLQRLMYKDEYLDSNAYESQETNNGLPFVAVRKRIILNHFPNLSPSEIDVLATQTRGLYEADIVKEITFHYPKTKKINYQPPDRLNTCNPITGSFTERLLSMKKYKEIFAAANMQLKFFNGFYNTNGSGIKKLLCIILNKLIQFCGKKGVHISPFILMISNKTVDSSSEKKQNKVL